MSQNTLAFPLIACGAFLGLMSALSLACVAQSAAFKMQWAIEFGQSNLIMFGHIGALGLGVALMLIGFSVALNAERAERVVVRRHV